MGTKESKTFSFLVVMNIVIAIGLIVLGVLYQNLNDELKIIQHHQLVNHKVRSAIGAIHNTVASIFLVSAFHYKQRRESRFDSGESHASRQYKYRSL